MSDRIQYLDLPGIFGAIQQIQGGQQRSRLLELQQQMEQQKSAAAQRQLAAQQAFGATLPADQQGLFQADPSGYLGATFERMKPGKTHPVTEGGALVDDAGNVIYSRPRLSDLTLEGSDVPGAPPPAPAPSANLTANAPPVPITPNYAANIKAGENTTGNTAAKNPNSSAVGDHQFLAGTWLDMYKTHWPDLAQGKTDEQILALRADPKISAEITRTYAADNAKVLQGAGFEATPTNLAIAHRYGPTGAVRILTAEKANPNAPLSSVLSPEALEANPELKGLTIAQGRARLEGHMQEAQQQQPGQQGGGTTTDPPGVRRILVKGRPDTTGADPGYQWAVDGQGNRLQVPIRGSTVAADRQREAADKAADRQRAAVRPMTPDEVSQHNLPPGTSAQIDGNGRVTVLQPGRSTQLSQGEKDAILESDKAVEAGNASIGALTKALELNDKAFSGATAEARAWADRNVLPGEWGGTATTELQNLISTQALNSLRAIFGGNPTEGERKILLDLQASVNKSPEERKIILDNALAGAKARVEREQQRGRSMRSGTYFTQGLPQQAGGGGSGGAPDPNNPQVGDRARNSQTGAMIEWNGSAWVAVQ